jgi:hypothetical protein
VLYPTNYNAGVVAVNSKVAGLAPEVIGLAPEVISHRIGSRLANFLCPEIFIGAKNHWLFLIGPDRRSAVCNKFAKNRFFAANVEKSSKLVFLSEK